MNWSTMATVFVVIALLIGVGAGLLIASVRKRGKTVDQAGEPDLSKRRPRLEIFVLFAFLLVVGGGVLLFFVEPKGSAPNPEIEMGLMVVVAIATLMTLLFIVSVGFNYMNLTDVTKPLGLPEGSIRAMIALFLIMIFILFGIYLFRMVGGQNYNYVGRLTATPEQKNFPGPIIVQNVKVGDVDQYDVWVATPLSDDGKRLAQQLITTVGTLVVAVAGFYFGSTTFGSAVAAAQGPTSVPGPVIKDATRSGPKGKQLPFEIEGTDFKLPKSVRLVRDNEEMVGRGILSSATKIQCMFMIDKAPDGKWDVIVENDDGKQAKLTKWFEITPA